MQTFTDRVAVITGGASGIGFAIAQQAIAEGMQVVLADVENQALCSAVKKLGDRATGVVVDVRRSADLKKLHDTAIKQHGAVHLLVNNAGVGGGGAVWESDEDYWDWVIDVNLKGVINGCRIFAESLIASGDAHVVNTASIAGLMSAPNTGPYTVSKHGVVALSEILLGDFRAAKASVGVSVLCPSFVNSEIASAERNRPLPESLKNDADYRAQQDEQAAFVKAVFEDIGIPCEDVAKLVFKGLRDERFYLLTHPEQSRERIRQRLDTILQDSTPSVSGPEAFPTEKEDLGL